MNLCRYYTIVMKNFYIYILESRLSDCNGLWREGMQYTVDMHDPLFQTLIFTIISFSYRKIFRGLRLSSEQTSNLHVIHFLMWSFSKHSRYNTNICVTCLLWAIISENLILYLLEKRSIPKRISSPPRKVENKKRAPELSVYGSVCTISAGGRWLKEAMLGEGM